ncbi:MAG: hypothetical protein AAF610_07810 [Pseudomonadota bacterium]
MAHFIRRPNRCASLDAPMCHNAHDRPVTRRDFLSQGFTKGAAMLTAPTLYSLFANPRAARAALSPDLQMLRNDCGLAVQGAGKIPFICFDLAGGAAVAASNVLVGQSGGQMDFLSTRGYERLGLPGDMIPPVQNPATGTNDFINTDFGLAFHSDSAFLRGMQERCSPGTIAATNGAIIPARSENDTGNNPHNPMYGIARAGADGELLTLVGSRNSDSGGSSMAPDALINPGIRPTKIDRPSDVTGLVDTGKLVGLLDQSDAVAVMESIQRISDQKLNSVNTQITTDDIVKDLVRCGYVKAADLSDRFGNPSTLDPALDPDIVGPAGIFSQQEFDDEAQFRKTASVMKLVINGFAGAGTVQIGGFDYHNGSRSTGETRDLRAGRCFGACLEYAARIGTPLMLYVFSDGTVFSDGMIDDSPEGRGKGVWRGDNSSGAASFFLVYNPVGRPQLFTGDGLDAALHQQLGHFRPDGAVETSSTPAANNVNLLVETVIYNYMALHGEQANFPNLFPGHGLGPVALRDRMTAFNPIVNGSL